MSIQELQERLAQVVAAGVNKPTDEVKFRERDGSLFSADYVLTAVKPQTLLICNDDGTH